MYFLSNSNGTPVITWVCCSTFVHVFRNELCAEVEDCLYFFLWLSAVQWRWLGSGGKFQVFLTSALGGNFSPTAEFRYQWENHRAGLNLVAKRKYLSRIELLFCSSYPITDWAASSSTKLKGPCSEKGRCRCFAINVAIRDLIHVGGLTANKRCLIILHFFLSCGRLQ